MIHRFIGLFHSILFAFLEDEEEDLDLDVVDDEECKKAEDIPPFQLDEISITLKVFNNIEVSR